ncbi:sugar phosphate isomerase/epimerase [Haloferula luteola]|uniref:Sugar phosphate isomerase/epimerase n=1 Tax=Haloferula luteola TaxID=595692 RepID=A0A840VFY9_9BACT|nr:sugar phosphate isomerase/epimerase family protein [Haloferula luteola]MBB5351711.1 sugar phosphate isomerase/epimerase [Haloferula luteola]
MQRLAIHTITTKSWDLPTAAAKYQAAGVGGAGIWRPWLEGRPLTESRRILDDHGIQAVSLVRGGFFPYLTSTEKQSALDDNRRALDEAAAIGAPQLVLVAGAMPELPLSESRRHIEEGLAACLDHARITGVKLALEPLHPMYADCRSAVNTLGQANDLLDRLGSPPEMGLAADVYHLWWDPALEQEILRAGDRICGFHVCDWLTPTRDFLNDRGLMGEGCIDIQGIRRQVEATGFEGWIEVEIFSDRWWSHDPDDYLQQILNAYQKHV